MPTGSPSPRRPPRLVRIVRARPRLFVSATVGVLVSALGAVWPDARPVTGVLVGWDLGVALYLVLAFHMMRREDVHGIRRRAAEQDEGQAAILGLTVAAALASVAAIFAELGAASGASRARIHIALAALTIVLSWAFVHTMFALHYAHEFYDETGGGGMSFPGGDPEPDYWDFVYFSFVIGMTSQVSDVSITSKQIRRVVAGHGIVAFAFNTALLALTVNLAASAI